MKRYISIVIASLFLFILSCDKKNDTEVGESTFKLNVHFVYGEEDFALNEVYEYVPLEYDLKIETIMLYLSHLQLINDNGESYELAEIVYLNAMDSSMALSFKIPAKQYKQFNFSMGVPQNLNGTNNEDFDAALYNPDHPLSLNNNMYWTWNTGYRFVRIDGRSNTDPAVDDEFETLISIHTGKDYCFRSKAIDISFTAVEAGTNEYTMIIDVQAFLANENDLIDIAVDNQSHGTNEALANRVSDNVKESISIE